MSAVTLSTQARDWLLSRGGEVTLRASPRHGCCGGHAAVPVAEAGVPKAREDYTEQEIDGVRVYLQRGLDSGPYRIHLEGFLSLRRLTVEGAVGPWTNKT
ncbi:MAG TPA: CC/Se motif family (seleno)protein [Thioalkalivibrio sp.]|nr:CC/Se motif family (seleno)protein [Thioalkalivibrio sp.]